MSLCPAVTGLNPDRSVHLSATGRRATVVMPLIWLGLWTISLSRNLFDPIGFDQAFWQYVLERVQAGQKFYVDLWDQNAPGVIGVHWLATLLVGGDPADLRLFDAGWQLLTMMLIAGLTWRCRPSVSAAFLAATLYALAYYAGGYVHTAQRDGFAVLPMLAALWLITSEPTRPRHRWELILIQAVAGTLYFMVFIIKPPLGLVMLAATLTGLKDLRRTGFRSTTCWWAWLALHAGFLLGAVTAAVCMMHWGWWQGFMDTMSRREVPGYVLGPGLIRDLLTAAMPALIAWSAVWALTAPRSEIPRGDHRAPQALRPREASAEHRPALRRFLAPLWFHPLWQAGCGLILVLTALWTWKGWMETAPYVFGPLVVVIGGWMGCGSLLDSRTARITGLTGLLAAAAIVLHGHFFLYHFWPLVACLSILAAVELNGITDRSPSPTVPHSPRPAEPRIPADAELPRQEMNSRPPADGPGTDMSGKSPGTLSPRRIWCYACVVTLLAWAGHAWLGRMTFFSTEPWVLAGRSLEEHYDRITRYKPRYPLYSTSRKVADYIQATTAADEPIACLINEPRIYYLSRRPPAHRLIIPNPAFRPIFADFTASLIRRPPAILVARIPDTVRGTLNRQAVHQAVFDDASAFFGPGAEPLRHLYRVAEIIDDVCVLRPVPRVAELPGGSSDSAGHP